MDDSCHPPPAAAAAKIFGRTESKAVLRSTQPSIQSSTPSSTQSSSGYFFSPNGKGLSGVFVAFFFPDFSMASRVRVSMAS